jgi:hypothetical protein
MGAAVVTVHSVRLGYVPCSGDCAGGETERRTHFELWETQMLGQTVDPRSPAYVEDSGDGCRSSVLLTCCLA